MPPRIKNIHHNAIAFVDLYGRDARQKVVDEIVRAVRDHDIRAAQHWERVGQAIDRLILAGHVDEDV